MNNYMEWFNNLTDEQKDFEIWLLWKNKHTPLTLIQTEILKGINEMTKEGKTASINTLAKYIHHDKNTVGKDVELLEMRGLVYTNRVDKKKYVMLRSEEAHIQKV